MKGRGPLGGRLPGLAAIVSCLGVSAPALAQEPTPDPTPDPTPAATTVPATAAATDDPATAATTAATAKAATLAATEVTTEAAVAERASEAEEDLPLSGMVREPQVPGTIWKNVGSTLLYLPREGLGLLFLGTSMAAAVLQDESTVPRFGNVAEGETRLYVFPTAFVETESIASIGARMIGASDQFATSLRAGVGGPEDTVLESRVYGRLPLRVPVVIGVETFFSRASGLSLDGIGQVPEEDARNLFAPGRTGDTAYYDESRKRGILSAGIRPAQNLEVLASFSADLRSLDETDDPGSPSIDTVFEPGSIGGRNESTRLWYGEAALRLDTRDDRGGPQEGLLLESYGGVSQDLPHAPEVSFVRVGGTAAAFVRVLRRSNVIIPRITLDGLAALGDTPVPFTELPHQEQFRGAGDRLDFVSWVGSVDYRWGFTTAVGARLFIDTAAVGPSVQELAFANLRWALGAGLDLWSTGSDIGSVLVAGGPDGFNFLLSLGISSGFGDRQHRD